MIGIREHTEGHADQHHALEEGEGNLLVGHLPNELVEEAGNDGDKDDVGQDTEQTDLKELVEEESVVEAVANVDEDWQSDVVELVVGEGQLHISLFPCLAQHLELKQTNITTSQESRAKLTSAMANPTRR